jgi:mRNA-degrading endonuclease RelE of RelBE toxin-antitoxin system
VVLCTTIISARAWSLASNDSHRLLHFVQFPSFLRDWKRLGLDDDAPRALERELSDDPDKGPVIAGTGGLRKLQFSPPGSGRGKSGAYRVCYAYFPAFGTIALFVAFGKNEQSELTADQAGATALALKGFEAELRRQVGRQSERRRSR